MAGYVQPPPTRAELVSGDGLSMSSAWVQWFTSVYGAIGTTGANSAISTAVRAYLNVTQVLVTATVSKILYTGTTFNAGNLYTTSLTRLVCQTTGYYSIHASTNVDACMPTLYIYVNGVEYSRNDPTLTLTHISINDIILLNPLDYVEIYIKQSSGSSKNIISGTNLTYFTATALS